MFNAKCIFLGTHYKSIFLVNKLINVIDAYLLFSQICINAYFEFLEKIRFLIQNIISKHFVGITYSKTSEF